MERNYNDKKKKYLIECKRCHEKEESEIITRFLFSGMSNCGKGDIPENKSYK